MVVIGLLTDFGNGDYYAAAMKAVILSICPEARVIDVTHEVSPFNVKEGAFLLWQAARWFPQGSILVGVVDPGVGGGRAAIAVRAGGRYLVGPDNGLLFPAAESLGEPEVREISEDLTLERSGTFDGRDVFAPAAARLAGGLPFEEIGPRADWRVRLELFRYRAGEGWIEAEVLHVDRFGNVVLSAPSGEWRWGTAGEAEVGGKPRRFRLVPSYSAGGEGELLLIRGSSGLLEISMKGRSAAETLGVSPGDGIVLRVDNNVI